MSDEPIPVVEATDTVPSTESGVRKEVPAAEALEQLKAGLPLENVRIRRLRLHGTFEKPVQICHCQLIQPEIDAAEFQDDVKIVKCTIDRLNCQKSTFARKLDLGSSILSRCTVSGLTVRGKFLAALAVFKTKCNFSDCQFEDRVNFWEAKLECWMEFKQCRFAKDADFRSIHADQGIVVSHCTFEQDFLLRGGLVQKKLQADGSRFEGKLDLSKAKLFDYVYLEGIQQGPRMRWALLNTVGDRILVRPEQLEGRLASEVDGCHHDAMQEYGLLKRCYQSMHRFDAEDWAFYRFKVNQRRSKPYTWRRPWTVWRNAADWLFLDVGCSYGTSPARAIRMALVIILGFAIIYGAGAKMFHVEAIPFGDDQGTLANRIMIGLTTSVSVFTSGMGGIRDVARGWMNVAVMIESIMGTLLFGLFIVAFSRKVIR
jgi:hypothetical protein